MCVAKIIDGRKVVHSLLVTRDDLFLYSTQLKTGNRGTCFSLETCMPGTLMAGNVENIVFSIYYITG